MTASPSEPFHNWASFFFPAQPKTEPGPTPLSSNPGQVEPGPFSEHDLREQWNAQADEFNQWESLDSCEQLAWAQTRAIAADRFLPPVAKPTPVDLAALHDPDFSNDLTASQHLDAVRGGPDPRVTATPAPLTPHELETERIMRLAEIIREVDGKHDLGAAALAEAILAHPDFSGCHDGAAFRTTAPGRRGGGMSRVATWRWLVRDVPAGQVLPPWLTVFQILLFPRRTLLWLLSRDCGFDLFTCCWKIHGVRFSDCVFMSMAEPRQGILYRFEREVGSDLVTVTEVTLPVPHAGSGFQIGPQEYIPDA